MAERTSYGTDRRVRSSEFISCGFNLQGVASSREWDASQLDIGTMYRPEQDSRKQPLRKWQVGNGHSGISYLTFVKAKRRGRQESRSDRWEEVS
jgi:hypothetical protein